MLLLFPRVPDRPECDDEPRQSTIDSIRTALECAGVEFIAENGGGVGVRFKKEIK
jgi:hypothetical protein